MSSQGFDTWVVEVRGAGLSMREYDNSASSGSCTFEDISGGIPPLDEQSTFEANSLRSSGDSSTDYDDLGISSTIIGPMREESLRLLKNVQDQLDSWERFVAAQMHLTSEYDWDFDHYLEEDIPAAVEYIRQHSKPKDGKLLAVGHWMGGILLYAMLSRSGFEGIPSNLAAIVTLASSVDYTTSNSSLKMLLPLAHPAQALNVPAIPLGTLLAAAYPWASGPPYLFSWLNHQI
ncbi:hypothetical protein ACP70R_001501 [Stipagrostis hirtigluma subsp. patula]